MCGRLNVSEDPLARQVSEALGVSFHVTTNHDLRPTQTIGAIASNGSLHQIDTQWGIKPTWSRKLLINAQAETVAEKPTFRRAFAVHRCIVPCSGWYEWKSVDGTKTKYLFERADRLPIYMAGIYYPENESNKLVTLTTEPTQQCVHYHHRMPLLITEENVEDWLALKTDKLGGLLVSPDIEFSIVAVR